MSSFLSTVSTNHISKNLIIFSKAVLGLYKTNVYICQHNPTQCSSCYNFSVHLTEDWWCDVHSLIILSLLYKKKTIESERRKHGKNERRERRTV